MRSYLRLKPEECQISFELLDVVVYEAVCSVSLGGPPLQPLNHNST